MPSSANSSPNTASGKESWRAAASPAPVPTWNVDGMEESPSPLSIPSASAGLDARGELQPDARSPARDGGSKADCRGFREACAEERVCPTIGSERAQAQHSYRVPGGQLHGSTSPPQGMKRPDAKQGKAASVQ